jgi:hypothetical protein
MENKNTTKQVTLAKPFQRLIPNQVSEIKIRIMPEIIIHQTPRSRKNSVADSKK